MRCGGGVIESGFFNFSIERIYSHTKKQQARTRARGKRDNLVSPVHRRASMYWYSNVDWYKFALFCGLAYIYQGSEGNIDTCTHGVVFYKKKIYF